MRTLLSRTLHRLTSWLAAKAAPQASAGDEWTGNPFADASPCWRKPGDHELLAELKGTAWTCASLNAAVCASFPPRLYVTTQAGQPAPLCRTRRLEPINQHRFAARPLHVEEVVEHPLLTLLRNVNPIHNAFDLWELTALYQEVHGSAYWHLCFDALGVPEQIWVLPSQYITPRRAPDSPRVVDEYVYQASSPRTFSPREVIHFRYPDPRNPYTSGLGPLAACFEQVALLADHAAMRKAIYDNHAIPAAVITPSEPLGRSERARLETQWNQKFRRGGSGRVLIGEAGLKVELLSRSMGDLAALADMRLTKEDICNAFGVPLAFLTSDTNLANLQAAEHQHLAKTIAPRLRRRDEKLNEQLVPLFDPSGRLFLASDDPVPANHELRLRQEELDLRHGVRTINELRSERGLPPVPWGDTHP